MKQTIKLVYLLFLFSCVQSAKKSETVNKKENFIDSVKLNYSNIDTTHNSNLEYLEWGSLKINNQFPLMGKKVDLIALLGQPDSIVTPIMNDICVSYFEKDFNYLYFRGSRFETSGEMAVISSICFYNSNIELTSDKLRFNKSVTIEFVKKIFPNAIKDSTEVEIDIFGKVVSVRLPASKKDEENAFILLFKQGKLIQIDYHMPC